MPLFKAGKDHGQNENNKSIDRLIELGVYQTRLFQWINLVFTFSLQESMLYSTKE